MLQPVQLSRWNVANPEISLSG